MKQRLKKETNVKEVVVKLMSELNTNPAEVVMVCSLVSLGLLASYHLYKIKQNDVYAQIAKRYKQNYLSL